MTDLSLFETTYYALRQAIHRPAVSIDLLDYYLRINPAVPAM
ncbi:hypothetical protein DSUL_50166 [Desulfovibrionales bacterium]